MLDIDAISLAIPGKDGDHFLLKDVQAIFPPHHFAAIVGPSGCGKSTLLKCVAGILEPTHGAVRWDGRDLASEGDLDPGQIGYVPQFSIAHDLLTVRENIRYAHRWRVAHLPATQRESEVDALLEHLGLAEVAGVLTRLISGGQKRRLGLALEMVSRPSLLLCDEVTSGLDVKSEDEIVALLHRLSREDGRIVLNVTHSLRHLQQFDSVTVLDAGRMAYTGPPDRILDYFGVNHPEEVFPALARCGARHWAYNFAEERLLFPAPTPPADADTKDVTDPDATAHRPHGPRTAGLPAQFWVLFCRRWRLFFRDPGQVALQLALIAIFPAIVALFAHEGLPQPQHLTMDFDAGVVKNLSEMVAFGEQRSRVGSLISGIVMFQVILLALMGSNNAAREIAAERELFEKEKLAGLDASTYVASKVAFLAFLVAAQSAWMVLFVKFVCGFPGPLAPQLALFAMANAAMTASALAISAWSRSPEKASLAAIYLVGFQLPLSGAVLPLPEPLGTLIRPIIAAYWSWAGVLRTIADTTYYDMADAITQTPLAPETLCLWVLGAHTALATAAATIGAWRAKWD